MKICFMATPDIALPTLQALIDNHTVTCVVTQPDKPVGRGKKMTSPPVKVLAESYNIPVLQPEKAKSSVFFDVLKTYEFDIIVVIAYGQILPKTILDMAKHGAINIHGSLLPKYRGAGPIQWAIINGEKTTGVTIMQMNEGMDTGDIILKREIQISNHTSGHMFKEMAVVGAEALIEAISQIENGTATRTPQDETQGTHAPMLTKEMGLISWNKTSQEIINLINGLNPWPVAYMISGQNTIKIYKAATVATESNDKPGTIINQDTKTGIVIKTADGALALTEIQVKGGKRMPSTEFLKGNEI